VFINLYYTPVHRGYFGIDFEKFKRKQFVVGCLFLPVGVPDSFQKKTKENE
jgi:hypothetical protein